jgi:hypothetical protein
MPPRSPSFQPDMSTLEPVADTMSPPSGPGHLDDFPRQAVPTRGTIAPGQATSTDQLRQFYRGGRGGIPQLRLTPLPSQAQPSINAAAEGIATRIVNEAAANPGVSSLTGDVTLFTNNSDTGDVVLKKALQNPNTVFAGPISTAASNLVQSAQASSNNSNTLTLAYPSPTIQGNLLIAVTTNYAGGHPLSISGGGNTWVNSGVNPASGEYSDLWFCVANGGPCTVAPAWPGTPADVFIQIFEFSGNVVSTPLDVHGFTPVIVGNTITPVTGGSVNQSTELVFAFCGHFGSTFPVITAGSNYTLLQNSQVIGAYHAQLQTAILNNTTGLSGIQNAPFAFSTTPTFATAGIATFKLANTGTAPGTMRPLVNQDLPPHTPWTTFSQTQVAQTSAIADTLMAVPVGAQMFRFTGCINCTAVSSGAVATLNLKYTDTANVVQTVSVSDTATSLTTTGIPSLVVALRVKAGTSITYGVTITNTPTYDVDVRLEQMN